MEQIIPKSIPNEIKKFNWGALLLNVIWGIRHRVWISLLTFVPVIGWIGMPILLGFKGNEWAWRKNNYTSTDQFLNSQRNWSIAALTIFISIPLVLYAMPLTITYGNEEPVCPDSIEAALFILNHNDEVISYLGDSIQKETGSEIGRLIVAKTLGISSIVEIDNFKVRGSKRAGIAKLKFKNEDNKIITDELIIYDDKHNIVVKK